MQLILFIQYIQYYCLFILLIFDEFVYAGCNFHLGQAFYRHLEQLGLALRYREDLQFNEECRMILALAFVPEVDVIGTWGQLMELPNRAIELDSPLAKYFERTYIGERTRTRRRAAVFAVEQWNVSELLKEDLPRTTNAVEGWHNNFRQSAASCHLSFNKLCEKIRQEQGRQEVLLEKLTSGHWFPKKRKYVDRAIRLRNLAQAYSQTDRILYLRGVAMNIEISW